jgi:hypothetical protein
VQIVDLGKQLPDTEASRADVARIWDEARRKATDPTKQQQFVRDRLEKLVERQKAGAALPNRGGAPAAENAAPRADRAKPNHEPESWLDEISRLTKQLPDGEAQQLWIDARLYGPADVARSRMWVKDRLEKLVAKHKANGTLRKPDDAAPPPYGEPPSTDEESLALQIIDLAVQLPDDDVKQIWAEARRKESDTIKQWQLAQQQLETLIAKHKADGTSPKPNAEPPDKK